MDMLPDELVIKILMKLRDFYYDIVQVCKKWNYLTSPEYHDCCKFIKDDQKNCGLFVNYAVKLNHLHCLRYIHRFLPIEITSEIYGDVKKHKNFEVLKWLIEDKICDVEITKIFMYNLLCDWKDYNVFTYIMKHFPIDVIDKDYFIEMLVIGNDLPYIKNLMRTNPDHFFINNKRMRFEDITSACGYAVSYSNFQLIDYFHEIGLYSESDIWAAKTVEIIEYLVSKYEYETHYNCAANACIINNSDLLQYLLQNNCPLETSENTYVSLSYLCVRENSVECLKVLDTVQQLGIDEYNTAVAYGCLPVLNFLLEKKIPIVQTNFSQEIYQCCEYDAHYESYEDIENHTACIQRLLAEKIPWNIQPEGDHKTINPVASACCEGHLPCIELYYKHREEFNIPFDSTCYSLDHRGAGEYQMECVQFLYEHGCKIGLSEIYLAMSLLYKRGEPFLRFFIEHMEAPSDLYKIDSFNEVEKEYADIIKEYQTKFLNTK